MLPDRSIKSIRKKAYELGVKVPIEQIDEIAKRNLEKTYEVNFKNIKGLAHTCRNRLRLWKELVYDKYEKCVITGKCDSLIVHHLKSFKDIFYETLEYYENKYNFIREEDVSKCIELNGEDLFENFVCAVRDNHKEDDGILISEEIHNDFHNKYGTRYCTKEDFYEYCLKYHNVNLKEK